ncbi:uncharacterized protein LOC129912566 [Episyrphus balteatus]|uniref:uncharacterized protein LOC129912566 n=1 Tax=Episyrphus balteatus TaxID=286459 RepID=UPI002486620A|nr:uncharacterized protein LOC129912566 [Episyrphus balteatus]
MYGKEALCQVELCANRFWALDLGPPPSQPVKMQENSWCQHSSQSFKDPILVIITFAAIIGSFSLLCGFVLLCVVSKTLNNEVSEAVLLVGMGFFITSVSYVTWKITNKRRIEQMILALKEEDIA